MYTQLYGASLPATWSWVGSLIALNHTTDLIWGHWLPQAVTQNVLHTGVWRKFIIVNLRAIHKSLLFILCYLRVQPLKCKG